MDAQSQAFTKIIINNAVRSSINDSFYLISDDINTLINDNITKYSPHFYTLFALIIITMVLNTFIFIMSVIMLRLSYKLNKRLLD